MICGSLITIVPLIIVGCVARWKLHYNYLTISGMLSGSCTNPSALAFANQVAGNDAKPISRNIKLALAVV